MARFNEVDAARLDAPVNLPHPDAGETSGTKLSGMAYPPCLCH